MDSVDSVHNFDEFKPYRDFENLFSGFSSQRKSIETIESTWMYNNFSGTDPDEVDLSFNDAENTIFNNNYSFKVGSVVYNLTASGIYVNGVLQAADKSILEEHSDRNLSGPSVDENDLLPNDFYTDCKSNKKTTYRYVYNNSTEMIKEKVAITSIFFRSDVHGKVVHYKLKNGHRKRSRAIMEVNCAGTIYDGGCGYLFPFNDRFPISGFKNKRQMKTTRHSPAQFPPGNGTIYKCFTTQVAASFTTPTIFSGTTLTLTF